MDIQLEKDLEAIRENIRLTRSALTKGVVERKAREAGKSIADYSRDVLSELESALSDFSKKLETALYGVGESDGSRGGELAMDIGGILDSIREHRRDITGGHIEDTILRALHSIDKKIMELQKKE